MRMAFNQLSDLNVLHMMAEASVRADRAPRGPLVRQCEHILGDFQGKRRPKRASEAK